MFTFRSAVADWSHVPTGSMKPTIMEGDRIVVNKLAYDLKLPFTMVQLWEWDKPKRGDVTRKYSAHCARTASRFRSRSATCT